MQQIASKTKKTCIATALAFAARRVSAHIQEIVAGEGLTVDQWSVFDLIVRTPSALAMSEIIEMVGLTGPSLTRSVDKLVAAALVYREIDPQDRRRVLLHPSNQGRETHARLEPQLKLVENRILEAVRAPEQFLQDLEGLGR